MYNFPKEEIPNQNDNVNNTTIDNNTVGTVNNDNTDVDNTDVDNTDVINVNTDEDVDNDNPNAIPPINVIKDNNVNFHHYNGPRKQPSPLRRSCEIQPDIPINDNESKSIDLRKSSDGLPGKRKKYVKVKEEPTATAPTPEFKKKWKF